MIRRRERPREFWFPIRTQYENLGDLEICVAVLELLRSCGPVRVERGAVPPSLHELLRLSPDELVERRSWYLGLLGLHRGPRARRVLVLKPGGLVNPRNRREQAGFLVRLGLVAAARASGAAAVQFCWSCGDLRPPWALLERTKARLLSAALPRDAPSAALLHRRHVEPVPDAALLSPDVVADGPAPPRDRVVLALRDAAGTGPDHAAAIGAAIRRLADDAGLRATVVIQVGRDAALAERLAAGAGVTVEHRWDPDRPASRHELFRAYHEAHVVISNRLHVLLVARLLGASVVAVTDPAGPSKVRGALASSAVVHHVVAPDALRGPIDPAVLEQHEAGASEAAAPARLRATLIAALGRV